MKTDMISRGGNKCDKTVLRVSMIFNSAAETSYLIDNLRHRFSTLKVSTDFCSVVE